MSNLRLGGHLLVDQLLAQGVRHVFCVPGESYLAVLDGLHDADIEITVCRQEGGAAMMADAYGKLTGQPGICMVTRGPGAANAMAGIHIAHQDSTPLILFVGQIDQRMRERDAFQEMDYRAVFGSQCKWATEIDHVERIPEIVARAFHVATSGRPGPVVIALPEDMLIDTTEQPAVTPVERVPGAMSSAQQQALSSLLAPAEKPIAIVGGSSWDADSCLAFQQFAEANHIPVAVQFRRQSLFSALHPNYIGDVGLGINPALLTAIQESDLVLLIGGRMSEVPSQSYSLFDIPKPRQKMVHVHPDSQELNRVYQSHLGITLSSTDFVNSLPKASSPAGRSAERVNQLNASYLRWSSPDDIRSPGQFQMSELMQYLQTALAEDTIMCNGAGNYATWLHRFHRFSQYGTQLAPTSGSMGYGLPAAVAAKRIKPDTPVVCFAGDGCFMMHGQEFATAVQYQLPIIVLIIDNGMYGTIRMHQEREYPGRVSATQLRNPNFAEYAVAFGGYGERVENSTDFAAAFERALASSKPAILHCILDPQAITPSMSLDQIRDAALAQSNK
ncbi:thiamine pyrophosphate-binding protein [Paenalcaligenes niemegkensis]|uniref:thiamine pyrophosphate-binding protein n=1 Tax=Paenalcaligenes niemegkensis TaxID=2895469 RepID=UPI00356931B0